jgi:hypothetical protein
VRDVCGVQAQDATEAGLSIRVRGAEVTADDVEQALVSDRSIVRMWAMRRTLHLIAAEDIGWLLSVLAPPLLAGMTRRLGQLGLDDDACRRGVGIIRQVLGDQGPMTRSELAGSLAAGGVDARGQRAPALLCRACLEGVVCHGPARSGESTYVLLADWTEPLKGVRIHAALSELLTRYIAAFGPATPHDFAAWSGLGVAATRAGWALAANRLTEVEVAGQPAWVLDGKTNILAKPTGSRPPVVRLLAGFDAYLLGYHDRTLALEARHSKRVNAGGGMVRPTISIDGRIVGTWRHSKIRRRHELTLEAFSPIPAEAQERLVAEAADVKRFLNGPEAE